ncbi:hypothetical protein SPAB_05407 [Salmonella enterica subsp. enterica serovar Paratyphi B str. SPB7]|uniref:Uncharacterized protein n=1 Tax=Salmonella paratyphi B (strain ATCC BAA-1250 / SPB7) TaxID=1016998 RepID=A0A6C6Z987_SALPB|nr:hypothetical protein SPAB_05407 [Salmonella enterica subsp. enterica serovar Paratyphi B str. SPB7]
MDGCCQFIYISSVFFTHLFMNPDMPLWPCAWELG